MCRRACPQHGPCHTKTRWSSMGTDFPESMSAVGSIERFTMSPVSGLTTRMRRRGRKKIREVMITATTEPEAAGDQEACTVTVQVQGLRGRCADTWLNRGASHTLSSILSIKPCGSLCCYPTAEIVFENQRTAERDRPRAGACRCRTSCCWTRRPLPWTGSGSPWS